MKNIIKFILFCFFLNGENSIVLGMDQEVDSTRALSPVPLSSRTDSREEDSEFRTIQQRQSVTLDVIPDEMWLGIMIFLGKEDRYETNNLFEADRRNRGGLWLVSRRFCEFIEKATLYFKVSMKIAREDHYSIVEIPEHLRIHLIVEFNSFGQDQARSLKWYMEKAKCGFVGLSLDGDIGIQSEDFLEKESAYYETLLGTFLNNPGGSLSDKLKKLKKLSLPGVRLVQPSRQDKRLADGIIIYRAGNFLRCQREKFRSNEVGVELSLRLSPEYRDLGISPARNISDMIEDWGGGLSDWVEKDIAAARRWNLSSPEGFESKRYKADVYAYAVQLFSESYTRTFDRDDINKVKELYDRMGQEGLFRFMGFSFLSDMKAFYFEWYYTWLKSPEEKDAGVRDRELSEFLGFLQGEVFDFSGKKIQPTLYANKSYIGEDELLYELSQYLKSWYQTDKAALFKVITCLSNLSKEIGPEVSRKVSSALTYVIQDVRSLVQSNVSEAYRLYGEGRYEEAAKQYRAFIFSDLFRTLNIQEAVSIYRSYAESLYFSCSRENYAEKISVLKEAMEYYAKVQEVDPSDSSASSRIVEIQSILERLRQ